jgi:hypothetical protein
MKSNNSLNNIKANYIITLIAVLFFIDLSFGQAKKMVVSVNINLKVDTAKTRVYQFDVPKENENIKTVVLKMKYGSAEIINPQDSKVLEESGLNIISVDIVYTDFRKQDVQDKINRKRVTELYFLTPSIFNQSLTQWKYIEQLGYATEDDAKKLFHGIVIKYMKVPIYKPESLRSMFSDFKKKSSTDTSLFRIFNKYIKFKEELVCVDLTGSMTPYYFQLFVWLNLKHSTVPLNYSFFNDGDATPDNLKRTGNTGGVYLNRTNSMDTVTSYAFACISNGNGGDSQENNIEAALKGSKKFPNSKEIIMIADNWSDMRDYALISEIKNPVRVIVCGTELYGIKTPVNPQYLDLARRTGGSVHTMEEDIEDLAKKKEGEEITIAGEKFVLRGGRFYKK